MCARSCRRDRLACIKKRAQFSLFCTLPKPWTGHPEYMKRKCAHMGASPLTCRSGITTNMSSILVERLVSVDANSRRGGFLPAAPKFCGFGPSLPPQNATNYTTLPAHEKTPAENRQGSSINPPTTNYGWGCFCTSFLTYGANISFCIAIIPVFSRFGTFLARGSIDSRLPNLEVPA